MEIFLLILLVAMSADVYLLKKQDRAVFTANFTVPPDQALIAALLVAALLLLSDDWLWDLQNFALIFFIPLYILRRQKFMSRDTARRAPTTVKYCSLALGVIIGWTYGIMVFGLLLAGIMDLYPDLISGMGEILLGAVYSSGLVMVLIYRASAKFSDEGFAANVALKKGGRSWVQVVLWPIAAGFVFAFISSWLIVTRQVQPMTPLNEVVGSTRSTGLMMGFLFLAVGAAPLVEEITFRGFFYRVADEWLGRRRAVYLITLAFAVLHYSQYWGDWTAIIMVTLLSYTLTFLRARTGTTLSSIVTHYAYNGFVTVLSVVMIAVVNPPYYKYSTQFSELDVPAKEQLLKESIGRQPGLADAYNELAWLYAEEEMHLDEALTLSEQSLQLAPGQPAYLDTKALVLEKLGRLTEARAIRERVGAGLKPAPTPGK